jgi:hypothetical protein
MTDEEKVTRLWNTVKNFNMAVSGLNLNGGFPELPKDRPQDLSEQLRILEHAHESFSLRGDGNVSVAGSMKHGFAINVKCAQAAATTGGLPIGGGGPVDCCNREITEINTMTLTGTFTVECPEPPCSGSCSFSRTWTRIPHTETFNDAFDQFWLWTENPPGSCNNLSSVFNQGDFLSPTAVCHDDASGLNGGVNLNEFTIFPDVGDTFNIVMQFQVTANGSSPGCVVGSCNDYSEEFTIPVTACNVSALLGDRVFTKACSSSGCNFNIEGHVIFA